MTNVKTSVCLDVVSILSLFAAVSYERVDEIIWVKTNQLQRIIRTGRTGHWLNHGKEHCLVCLSLILIISPFSSCVWFSVWMIQLEALRASFWATPALQSLLFVSHQVGVKGNPQGFNRGLDCDVIVAEVRDFHRF